jgi:uncharacterized membrane protein
MDQRISERRERFLLWAILAAAICVRFYRLGRQSLWVDEMLSIGAYSAPPGVSFWEKLLWDVHGPLYSLILHFWSVVSSSEAWLRAPSAITGVASVYLCYRWLISLGRRDCALIGALFLALSPFNLYYSQELRFYSQLTMFLFLSLIVFRRFLSKPTYANGALLGVSLAATCFSHFSGGFLCLGLVVYLFIAGRVRGMYLRAGVLAALVVFVMISPWIYREITFLRGIQIVDVSTIPVGERYRGELTLSAWSYPYTFYAFSVGYTFGPSLRELHTFSSPLEILRSHGVEIWIIGHLFGLLAILGCIRSVRTGDWRLFLSITAVTILGVTLLTKFNIKIFNARYLMCAFPVFIALISYGTPVRGWRRYAVIIAVCAVMIYAIRNHHFVDDYAKEDVRGAVRLIEEHELAGDAILAPSVQQIIQYYYTGSNYVPTVYPRYLDAETVTERLYSLKEEYGRIWYVRSRHWETDPDDRFIDIISQEREVESWTFPGVIVFLFRHAPTDHR